MSKNFIASRVLVKKVAMKLGVSVYLVDKILTELSNEVIDSLNNGSDVKIRGLATLKLRVRKEQDVYSPYDGHKVHVPERTVVKVEAAPRIKNVVDLPVSVDDHRDADKDE
jgi:nucleoid DNA-binding protein